MNKSFKKYLIYISVIGLLAAGCANNSNVLTPFEELNYRKIAHNYLYSKSSAPNNINLDKSKVEFGKYNLINNIKSIELNNSDNISFILINKEIKLQNGQGLVAVFFYTNTVQDELMGPSIVIIEPISQQVIGIVPQN